MKAMIFAAGLGTRLKPYTQKMPKAMVPVMGRPMIEWVIRRLIMQGVTSIIINLHHFPEQIIKFIKANHYFGIDIHFLLEEQLLNTGGGLKNAAWFFEDVDQFILHNTDIISTIDLNQMLAYHNSSNAQVTLSVRDRETSRYLLFDATNQLCGWLSKKEDKKIWVKHKVQNYTERAFSGIHIISTQSLKQFPSPHPYSIIPEYLKLAATDRISGFNSDRFKWLDLGKESTLKQVKSIFGEDYFSQLEQAI